MAGAEDIRSTDPRVRRTRRMLQDALAKLLQRKGFEKISIGDIAEESGLNRATFYAHYPDKFALLECLVGTRFQELVIAREIRFDGCGTALKNIALGVCFYLAETMRPGNEGLRQASTPLEGAIVAVIRGVLREGFAKHPPRQGVSAELLGATIGWAIYGAAREWLETENRVPAEEMGEVIGAMVSPMLAAAG